MWDEEKFLLVINLLGAGYQGYLKITSQSSPSKEQVQDKLIELYYQDPKLAAVIDQMQKDYNNGKMVAIPVYKPNSLIFDHFIYAFKFEWPKAKTTKIEAVPGDAQWKSGLARIERAFERAKTGEANPYDKQLLKKFSTGECLGDPKCDVLQDQIVDFYSDEEFLEQIYSNPEILQEFWALMKALEIFDKMPEGEAKQKLKDFLCVRFPDLYICEGEYRLQLEQSFYLIEMEEVPEEFVSRARVLEATLNSILAEYQEGLIGVDEAIQKILLLDEEAEGLLAEYARDKARVTRLVDPSQDPSEELIGLATKLLDILSQAEFLKKQLKSGAITKSDFDSRVATLKNEYDKVAKKFREMVKDSYVLPDELWEQGTVRAFKSNWVNTILKDINGSRLFAKLKISLQIYQRVFQQIEEVFIKAHLNENWRLKTSGKWGSGKAKVNISGTTKAPGSSTSTGTDPIIEASAGQMPITSAIETDQSVQSGDWDFNRFSQLVQKLSLYSISELLDMLESTKSKIMRDAILSALLMKIRAGEGDVENIFLDKNTAHVAFFIVDDVYYVIFGLDAGQIQDDVMENSFDEPGYQATVNVWVKPDGTFFIEDEESTIIQSSTKDWAANLEAERAWEEKIAELMKDLGYKEKE